MTSAATPVPVRRRTAAGPRAALATVCAVLFLTFLDTTIVSVCLGDVQQHLGAGVVSLQWVVNSYALVFASLMLTAGSLGDRLGRKWVMLGGLVVFAAGSVVCAAAPTVAVLVTGRAVMGVGAAAAEPGTLSVLRHLYPDERQRARALGVWAAVSGLALALGPVVGGLLVGAAGWRAVFWFNLAVAGLLLAAVAVWVPNSADPRAAGPDVPGFLLGSGALAVAVYAVIAGEQHGFGTGWVVALFAAAALALIAFVWVESRVAHPMLDLAYVRAPVVASSLFVAFAVYFGVFSIFFFTALYLDAVEGYSGWRMAGVFAPMAVAIVAGSLLTGRWVARRGPRVPMVSGCVAGAAGMLLARAELHSSPAFWPLAAALAVAGLGFGVAVVPLTSAVLTHVPAADSGMAASATNTSRQIGAVAGVAALGALVNAQLTSGLGDRLSAIGVSHGVQAFVIAAIEGGGGSGGGIDLAHVPALFRPIVDAAVGAFLAGLRQSLLVSAVVVLLAAAVAAVGVRPRSPAEPELS